MREVCFLIGTDGSILWADASTSASALPDSRERWEAIWQNREQLSEIAHSHPGVPLGFSAEDESTMAALTQALGRALRFSVVAPNGVVVRQNGVDVVVEKEPWWAGLLRMASGMR
ncbi:hypothetical protein BH09MYX1_BH09MYX1_57600 [soil metagenome]